MIGCDYMEPVHIVTDKENISELVLMPGDPLRAKYIAEKFLDDAKLVNDVRNMLGYTGYYKEKRITVIGSGMGIPSMGIYSYELAKFYGVKKIIRIGSAGTLDENVKIRDLVVATSAKSLSTMAVSFSGDESKEMFASPSLLEDIKSCEKDVSCDVHFAPILTSDIFDVYSDITRTLDLLDFKNPSAVEMEAFGLYYIGKITGMDVATIVTIVDSKFTPNVVLTSEERETSLNDMITLALEAIIR